MLPFEPTERLDRSVQLDISTSRRPILRDAQNYSRTARMNNPACRGLRIVTSPGRIAAGPRIESSGLRFLRRTALLLPPSAAVHCVRPAGIPPVGLFLFADLMSRS
jgi:hypothetical protein